MESPGIQQKSFDTWIKFGLVIALTAVAAWNPSLISNRLPSVGESKSSFGVQDIPVRLWQDPFSSIDKYIERNCNAQEPSADNDPACQTGDIAGLNADIKRRAGIRKNKDVDVFYVLVSGSNAIGADEARRRTRYAVLSGIAADNYSPIDPVHIGHVKYSLSGGPVKMDIPFEWMAGTGERNTKVDGQQSNDPPPILLAWINEDKLQLDVPAGSSEKDEACSSVKPLAHLKDLIDSLSKGEPNVRSYIIGPSSSNFLADAEKELAKNQCAQAESKIGAFFESKNMQWYSPLATAKDIPLVDKKGNNESDNPLKYRHMIIDDPSLLKGLLGELSIRLGASGTSSDPLVLKHILNNSSNEDNWFKRWLSKLRVPKKILLVGQLDTTYSRGLVKNIEALVNPYCVNPLDSNGCANNPIIVKNYLRGLDGRTANGDKKSSGQKPGTTGSGDVIQKVISQSDRPEGEPQIDYLRRLGQEVDDRTRREGFQVAAVGILGDDYHDKLLALEELRSVFHHAIFFTTDLDSAMFYHFDNRYTRNMIVAANYGLYLNPALQGDIPPFRDSYQTATFLATRVAMQAIKGHHLSKGYTDSWLKPHIFEIGRSRPVALNMPGDKTYDAKDVCSSLADCTDPNPPTIYKVNQTIYLLAFIIFVVALAILYYKISMCNRRGGVKVLFSSVLIALVLLIFLHYYDLHSKDAREPLDLVQGVSIWPTEFIRLLAIFIGWGLVFRARAKIAMELSEVARIFKLPPLERSMFRSWRGKERSQGEWRNPWRSSAVMKNYMCKQIRVGRLRSISGIWECYIGRRWHHSQSLLDRPSTPVRMVFKMGAIIALIISIAMVGASLNWPRGVVPARGHFAATADRVVLGALVLTFVFLASYTIDMLVRALWLVNTIRSNNGRLRISSIASFHSHVIDLTP